MNDGPLVIKANKREVPPDMPPTVWWELVNNAETQDFSLLWYDPVCEYLRPTELRRLRAKVFIWNEATGNYPDTVDTWWEPRMARRRGEVPASSRQAMPTIFENTLTCGFCNARWTYPYPLERCKLCDTKLLDAPEEQVRSIQRPARDRMARPRVTK